MCVYVYQLSAATGLRVVELFGNDECVTVCVRACVCGCVTLCVHLCVFRVRV